MREDNFGIFAAGREKQVIVWASDNSMMDFTAKYITDILFEGRKVHEKVYDAYSVACEDLARRQNLKRMGNNSSGKMRYIFNQI